MDSNNQQYRHALGNFSTGVAVVSGLNGSSQSCGITINSFSSVSLEPRIILFSLRAGSSSLPCFQSGRPFAISVLGKQHQQHSRRFASAGADRWEGVAHAHSSRGCPVLDDALVVIEGVVDSVREVGDHVIIFGRVEQARSRMDIEPLVFFRGAYEAIAEKRALIASPSASPI